MKIYEVLKECWINGSLYKANQSIQLTEAQATEWIDRSYIKAIVKELSKKPKKPEDTAII